MRKVFWFLSCKLATRPFGKNPEDVRSSKFNLELPSVSWHEMGVSDLPAVIDYILEITGSEQILYGGHSMGTTMFYVLASQRPEYNSKIRVMFSLAPVAFMSHLKSPIVQMASKVGDELKVTYKLIQYLCSVVSSLGWGGTKSTWYIGTVWPIVPTTDNG
jgi:pimeloyl-ACP methyl ester carboxylesterase